LMKEGWEGLLGVKLFLIVVARAGQDINMADFLSLGDDSLKVARVPEGMSSMQASQWARIFAAGLVEAPPGGMNIISDMDMLPASARYFHAPLHRLRKEESEMLVYYRHGILDNAKEIAVGYIAGHPGAWRRLTGVHSWEDFGRALKNLPNNYGNVNGGVGWNGDQLAIYEWVHDPVRTNGTLLASFKDKDLDFARYDVLRSQQDVYVKLKHARRCRYTDIHMKAHDKGLPGPYWDLMKAVTENCNLRAFQGTFNGSCTLQNSHGDTDNLLCEVDELPVFGISVRLPAPNLTA
jgi:hypothetical protein